MPYQGSSRLPAEFASKTSHMDVLEDDLIKDLVNTFESVKKEDIEDNSSWEPYEIDNPLPIVFSVDGSFQIISSDEWPYRKIVFVKIALVMLNNKKISELNKDEPHPMKIRDILADSSDYHSNVIPLQHVKSKNLTTYDTVREVIFRGMKDKKFDGEILETLKWIAYEKWDKKQKDLPLFDCPHCHKEIASLSYDSEEGICSSCSGHLFITDMLGFHQVMEDEFAPDTVASDYMTIYEILVLFTCIRLLWENHRKSLENALFVKDGPLSIRAQYSKLVNPIRRFLEFARNSNNPVYLTSQEKSGRFADHMMMIQREAPEKSVFIPGDKYIKRDIQQRSTEGQEYGKDTNFGSKVFVKINNHHCLTLNMPTGRFNSNPKYSDIIGINRILGTVISMLSSKHESGLIPIEMAHGIASLSTYPSAKILRILAEEKGLI